MAFELGGEVGKILLLISLSKRQGMIVVLNTTIVTNAKKF